jgi:hypothetical protein
VEVPRAPSNSQIPKMPDTKLKKPKGPIYEVCIDLYNSCAYGDAEKALQLLIGNSFQIEKKN